MSQETLEQTFVVTQQAQLKVSNICGSVDIQPGSEGEIKVTAVKHLDSGNADRTRIEIKQESDGRVIIKTHYDHDHGFGWLMGSRPCNVDYSVVVPITCAVQVQTVSSRTNIKGLHSDVKIKAVSGDIAVLDLTSNLEVDVVSADVTAERINGHLIASAVSGCVNLRASNCPSIKASTVSGDMKMDTPLGGGPYNFRSVSGSIHLIVPGETSCRVHMSSISGRLHTDLPVTSSETHQGHKRIEVQGGGVLLDVNTVSGRFSLEHTGEVKPEKILKTPAERKAVLEKISAGEMSVEEGLKELNS